MLTQISRKETHALIDDACKRLGYGVEKAKDTDLRGENFFRRVGVYLAYSSDGACVAKASWDSGARRPTPGEFKFRTGSPHHRALLELLRHIAEHSRDPHLAARLELKH